MKIMDQPFSKDQLQDLSRKHDGRVRGVIAVPWFDLLDRSQEPFEEEICRRVTGSRYGLIDLTIKVAGCLGDDILFEVGGDVTHLLADYETTMAEEATPAVGELIHGVDVARVVALAKRQILEAGLHLRAGSFSALHDFVDANMLGFHSDQEHLADGTAFGDLGVERAVEVMNRVQSILDAWLRSGQARRQAEGGGHAP